MYSFKEITLDKNQFSKLIEQNSIFLDDDCVLQLVDYNLVLNKNGEIYNITKFDIQFKKREIENEFVVSDLKQLICHHLNLDVSEVIYSNKFDGCYDFYIRFDAKTQWKIVVCDFSTAVSNTAQLTNEKIEFAYDAEEIGLYKRLGNSAYYFRWFNDI